jgi:hypothetical protein
MPSRDQATTILADALEAVPEGLTRAQLDLNFAEAATHAVSGALLGMLAANIVDARLDDGRILYSLASGR